MKICNTQGKVYNEAMRSYIDLNEGEVWCPSCKGVGSHPPKPIGNYEVAAQCKKCNGHGKLDWIARVVGLKEPFDYDSFYASEMAEEIAKAIDKEIIDSIIFDSNKIQKEDNV